MTFLGKLYYNHDGLVATHALGHIIFIISYISCP